MWTFESSKSNSTYYYYYYSFQGHKYMTINIQPLKL